MQERKRNQLVNYHHSGLNGWQNRQGKDWKGQQKQWREIENRKKRYEENIIQLRLINCSVYYTARTMKKFHNLPIWTCIIFFKCFFHIPFWKHSPPNQHFLNKDWFPGTSPSKSVVNFFLLVYNLGTFQFLCFSLPLASQTLTTWNLHLSENFCIAKRIYCFNYWKDQAIS